MIRTTRAAAVAAVVVAALAFAGVPAGAKTVDPEDWAKTFCGSLLGWTDGIEQVGNELRTVLSAQGDPEGSREALVSALVRFRKVTKTARTKLRKAGEPDVESGEEIAQTILDAFGEFGGRLRTSLTAAKALPVGDPEAFAAAIQALQIELSSASTVFDDTFTTVARLDDEGSLESALEEVEECAPITG